MKTMTVDSFIRFLTESQNEAERSGKTSVIKLDGICLIVGSEGEKEDDA